MSCCGSPQTTLRMEKVGREIGRELSELARELRTGFLDMREEFRAQRADLRDLREANRAQTQALLRILDRLDNGGAAAG